MTATIHRSSAAADQSVNRAALQQDRVIAIKREPVAIVTVLNRLLVRAILELGRAGRTELACHLAAEGWALLRRDHGREAERLNGVLHSLTRSKSPATKPNQETDNG